MKVQASHEECVVLSESKGETDWKILCINVEDSAAKYLKGKHIWVASLKSEKKINHRHWRCGESDARQAEGYPRVLQRLQDF